MAVGDDDHLRRVRVAAGLHELAGFIARTVDFPVPPRIEITYPIIRETDDSERAEIDRIARILGETPRFLHSGHHYSVTRKFGPVRFTATAITKEHMERYQAEMEAGRRFGRQMWGD